jgi:citrate synthase
MTTNDITLHRGLSGVYFDRSATTFIDGKEGILEYRGYNINELAGHSTFEETAYLLIHGALPTQAQLDAYDAELKGARELPEPIFDVIDLVKDSHPMDALRTAVSALAGFDPDRNDNSSEATIRKGLRLTSQVPSIVMAHHNIRNGKDPIKPSTTLNHAGNFLYMMDGKEPSAQAMNLMDKDFILHADHGSNASAFTARVVAGTAADIHGAVTAGIAALSGPSHGGAAENVMQMAREIGKPENAADYVHNLLSNRKRVMGFGHRATRPKTRGRVTCAQA